MGKERKPQLLFLCQTLPYPPDGGVEIRSFNTIRLLSRHFDITGLCFYRRRTRGGDQEVAKSLAGLSAFGAFEAFPIPQEQSRVRLLWDHLRSLVFGQAYTRFAYESKAFARRLFDLLAERRFALAHVDSLDLSCYLPYLRDIPVVCTHHNVESQLLRRRSTSERSPLVRWYMRLQGDLTEREERRWLSHVNMNVAVSEDDARSLRSMVDDARIAVIPNGVDTLAFRPANGSEEGLVFVGGYGWYPNRDAMAYFAEHILPVIRRRIPDVPLTWIGRAPSRAVSAYRTQHGITLSGYLRDIRPIVQQAACYVVPLRVGGGSRLKVLDAWAMGKAVVSTSVGCEGLDARDGQNILVRDTPQEFAAAVISLIQDPELRRAIGSAARRTAVERYEWELIGEHLKEEYCQLLGQGELDANHE